MQRIAIPGDIAPAAFRRRSIGAAITAMGGETMGTSWSVRAVAPPPGADAMIRRILDRVIAQMSNWQAGSDISRFNRSQPGRWQMLPAEFAQVLAAGLAVAAESGGAFDPAIGHDVQRWGFGPAGGEAGAHIPLPHRAIEQDATARRARRTEAVALDFSGIAKGYAVDAVARALLAAGCADFLVEIGGELRGEGIRPDGQPWWVDVEAVPGSALPPLRVALHGLSIAGSGDYRRCYMQNGRRIAHTIDPRSGAPIDNGIALVTLLHRDCMLADAWATALSVAGPDEGMALAAREGLAARIVVREGTGFREHLSPALEAMLG